MAQATDVQVGFLGAGRMATALARGWLDAGLLSVDRCRASDPVAPARQAFTTATNCPCHADNRAVVAESDLLVLAVKPQSMAALLAEIRPVLHSPLVVSIAAGVNLRQLTDGLGAKCRLIR